MGFCINFKEINESFNKYNDKVIITTNYSLIKDTFNSFNEISLGIKLTDELIRYSIENRKNIILTELDNLLLKSNYKNIIIKDIDVLFNPEYKLDILKYFIRIARLKNIIVIWNGIITDEYLQYSEVNYLDYKKYLIKNYDVICVK